MNFTMLKCGNCGHVFRDDECNAWRDGLMPPELGIIIMCPRCNQESYNQNAERNYKMKEETHGNNRGARG